MKYHLSSRRKRCTMIWIDATNRAEIIRFAPAPKMTMWFEFPFFLAYQIQNSSSWNIGLKVWKLSLPKAYEKTLEIDLKWEERYQRNIRLEYVCLDLCEGNYLNFVRCIQLPRAKKSGKMSLSWAHILRQKHSLIFIFSLCIGIYGCIYRAKLSIFGFSPSLSLCAGEMNDDPIVFGILLLHVLLWDVSVADVFIHKEQKFNCHFKSLFEMFEFKMTVFFKFWEGNFLN